MPLKLYGFTVEVRDGEHEYSYYQVIRARSHKAADKRARHYTKTFLGSRMQWIDERTLESTEGWLVEYRMIKYDGVYETTPEEILARVII